MISGENPISIGQKYVKLQLIKEIQISRQMTTYGQNQGILNAIKMNVLAQLRSQGSLLGWYLHRSKDSVA